ncbi:hypothetical protein [Alloprevotella tannerae]|uniref:hypothetical protein n=1 Tax=Alloprevotella tannerae TaxID=76122 RepID=UPI0028EE2AF5|nr:hypothetical protein [Alloprevotella tannerae]
MFTVYYNCPVEIFEVAKFETLEEAKAYCEKEVQGLEEIYDNDTDCDSSNTNHCYEVYDGEMFEVDEDGEIIEDNEPIFVTKRYYNEFN